MSTASNFSEDPSLRYALTEKEDTPNRVIDLNTVKKDIHHQLNPTESVHASSEGVDTGVSLAQLFFCLSGFTVVSILINDAVVTISQPKSIATQLLLEIPITMAILFFGLKYTVWKRGMDASQVSQLEWKSRFDALESKILAQQQALDAMDEQLKQKIQENKHQEQLQHQKHRLENIGMLASGVAHDLNNALAPIVMSTDLLYDICPDAKEVIDTIETCARRGTGMVQQLLTYAKGVGGEKICVMPGHMFKEIESIISRTFPANIEVVTHYSETLNAIHGDPTQVHQVLLNLCVNARDAMPNGGMLALQAENVDITKPIETPTSLEAKPGQYVACHVRDTGKGISNEMLTKIFTPFVSTKENGKGTGIGLSTVIKILKSHQGFLTVKSEMDKGTMFSAYFPACPPEPKDPALMPSHKMRGSFNGNGEVILVVDDDVNIRKALSNLLEKLNFKVLTAPNGADAIVQATDYRNDLFAIITDFHMPHVGGLVFLRLLRQMLPETPLVVTSGNFKNDDLLELEKLGISNIMKKPFASRSLLNCLESIKKATSRQQRTTS